MRAATRGGTAQMRLSAAARLRGTPQLCFASVTPGFAALFSLPQCRASDTAQK
jgi:hypothetical protein